MSNVSIYIIGVALVAAAVAFGAHMLGASPGWITVIVLAIVGIGVTGAIVKTRLKEVPPSR